MKKKLPEPSIKNRSYSGKFTDEYSSLDYNIVASREIIQEIEDKLHEIENKYPKRWDD